MDAMTELKQEESQKELFQEFSGDIKKTDRFPALARSQKPVLVSTSVEQIVFCGILAILVLCFMFFLGVLRGKSLGNVQAPETKPVSLARPQSSLAVMTPLPAPPIAVVPAATKAVEMTRAADPSRPYTIVLVTYKKKTLAEKEVAALKSGGTSAFVASSGDYFIVCAGQYANIAEAKKDLKVFGARYKGCFLKRR